MLVMVAPFLEMCILLGGWRKVDGWSLYTLEDEMSIRDEKGFM